LVLLVVLTFLQGNQGWDIMSGLEAFGNTFCADGGGLKYWSTGPEQNTGGYPCGCSQQQDGSWTWCGYDYECAGYYTSTGQMYYYDITQTSATPYIVTAYYDNNSSTTDTIIFTKSQSSTNTYSWTFSCTFTVGETISVTAGIPDICQVNDQFSESLSLTSSETQTGSDTKSWSITENINIPPYSTVRVDSIITMAQYNALYTMPINFNQNTYGNIWCYSTVNGHYEWFIPPAYFLNASFGNGIVCNGGSCNITGAFLGIQGINLFVNKTQCPLGVQC